ERHLGVERGQQQWPPEEEERDQHDCSDQEQGEHLSLIDAQERPEQKRLELLEHAVIEAQKEKAKRQAGDLYDPDRGRLAAVSATPPATLSADRKRRHRAGQVVSDRARQARQSGSRRTWKGHHGNRVPGE